MDDKVEYKKSITDKFKKIAFKKRTRCMICNSLNSDPVISLPNFPLTEIYVQNKVTEKLGFVDQEFCFCRNCGHGQISNIIDSEIVYGENYATRTSISSSAMTAIDVFLDFVKEITGNKKFKRIIDIGCNDLYALKKLSEKADSFYGIDPIWKDKSHTDNKINVIGDFVENLDFNQFDLSESLILSSHTIEHIEDPQKLVGLLVDNSSKDTIFFFQFPSFEYLVKTAHFDQIFHQHLNYFTLASVLQMLESVGAELVAFKTNPWHWGTLMIAFKKKNTNAISRHEQFRRLAVIPTEGEIKKKYAFFKDLMRMANERMCSLKDERVYGFGAALMLPVQSYYIKSLSNLKYIIDDDKSKEGLYYLNFPIQIISSEKIADLKSSTIFICAINSKVPLRGIISKLLTLNVKEIIIPLNMI
jgi:cyclopropane-fatty-acyl-phospholipid synthase